MRYAFPRGAPPVRALMGVLAIPENSRYAALDDDELNVRLGWSFQLTAPRESVVAVLRDHDRIGGIGAHGWRGTWLVNTSSHGLARIVLDPPARATVCGVPVTVKVLRVSVAEPDAFLAALQHGSQG
jgi:hypothetical protein